MNFSTFASRETGAIAELLDNRFGGGLIYLEEGCDRPVFTRAQRLGLIDEEGLITDVGLSLWQRRRDQAVVDSTRARRPHRLRCEEVWGGTAACDREIHTGAMMASVHASVSRGGHGGDVYYVSVCEEDALTRVVVADVVGHGAPVSCMSRLIYDALRAHRNETDGGEMLASINQIAANRGLEAMTTAAVVAYYRDERRFYYSYAGHSPAFINRGKDSEWILTELEAPPTDTDTVSNVPLAIFENARFDQRSMPLAPGDRIFLYTDGVVDAPSADSGRFGLERLKAVLDRHAGADLTKLKQGVLEALQRHTDCDLSHDDVTMVALELL